MSSFFILANTAFFDVNNVVLSDKSEKNRTYLDDKA